MGHCDEHKITDEFYPTRQNPVFTVLKCAKCKQILGIFPNNTSLVNALQVSIGNVATTISNLSLKIDKIEGKLDDIAKKK